MVKSNTSIAHGQRAPQFSHPEVRALAEFYSHELESLVRRLNAPAESRYRVQHREPTRLEIGMVMYADGTDWNPGSGEGLYVYTSTGWIAMAAIGADTATLVELTETIVEQQAKLLIGLERIIFLLGDLSDNDADEESANEQLMPN